MIEVSGVSFSYSGTPILSEVDLAVPRGGVTALVGPNGAGKSTLLSLIGRLLPLTSGSINISGQPVHAIATGELARKLAIMPQHSGIACRLRVRELVGFGRFPHHRGRPDEADRQAVAEALTLFDLESLAERFVDTLSGGQRQRARAAMAFAQGTDYLLLDEPLNNLDIFYARELMRMLRRAADERGRTIIIVLHDLNHAAVHADRIVAMRDGRIVADGAVKDVMMPDVLEKVFGYRIEVETVAGHPISLHFL